MLISIYILFEEKLESGAYLYVSLKREHSYRFKIGQLIGIVGWLDLSFTIPLSMPV